MTEQEKKEKLESLQAELESLSDAIAQCESGITQSLGERSYHCSEFTRVSRQYIELSKGNEEYII